MRDSMRLGIMIALVCALMLAILIGMLLTSVDHSSKIMAIRRENEYLRDRMQVVAKVHAYQQEERMAWEARCIEKIETCEALTDLGEALDEIEGDDCRASSLADQLDDDLDRFLVEHLVKRLVETKKGTP